MKKVYKVPTKLNLPELAGDNAGYQLRITYLTDTAEYKLAGFIGFPLKNDPLLTVEWERDGSALTFNSMSDVLEFVVKLTKEDSDNA